MMSLILCSGMAPYGHTTIQGEASKQVVVLNHKHCNFYDCAFTFGQHATNLTR